jgi:protein gp37
MGDKSKIEWTDATWNPVIGCSKISPGCRSCYALRDAVRLSGNPNQQVRTDYRPTVENHEWTGITVVRESQIDKPSTWKKPRRIFVCSMGDLFHESVQDASIDLVFDVINACPWHTFQLLTKRPERMRSYLDGLSVIPTNVWCGVTAENQDTFDARVPILLQTRCDVRFVSCEPLLSAIDIRSTLHATLIDWLIVGGETGPRARCPDPAWIYGLRDQCLSANVPFFFKSWGEYNSQGRKVGKKNSGRDLAGWQHDAFPKAVTR